MLEIVNTILYHFKKFTKKITNFKLITYNEINSSAKQPFFLIEKKLSAAYFAFPKKGYYCVHLRGWTLSIPSMVPTVGTNFHLDRAKENAQLLP